MPDVRKERTEWRDLGLSKKHREWGFDCPAIDIDFLLTEYDRGVAKALIEYKNEHAELQYPSHPSYKALIDLGNRAQIPVIACRYTDDYSKYTATALNEYARNFIPEKKTIFDERGWITLLYKIRGYEITSDFFENMGIEI